MAGTITSANAVLAMAVASVFPVAQQLQGFSVDDVFDTDVLDSSEVLMGVDGVMSAGFVFVPIKQNYSLQADSPSNSFFEAWYAAQQAARDIFLASGIISLPSLGRVYVMNGGVLSGYKPLADAKKVMQPRKFTITWQSVGPGPA